jgi:hypothetical protein
MISIGSRATKDVALPCAKTTHACIIKMFKRKMLLLWDRLTVRICNLLTDILSHKYSRLGFCCRWANQCDMRRVAGQQH